MYKLTIVITAMVPFWSFYEVLPEQLATSGMHITAQSNSCEAALANTSIPSNANLLLPLTDYLITAFVF